MSGSEEKRDFGKEFEEEVKIFLEEKLGFVDVKGGPGFHIGGEGEKNQIDACGRYGEILFVFECKASGRRTKRSLRQDILATQERARIVLDNYKSIPEYAGCRYVKFIFITKKIEIPETEKDLFKGTYVWYADDNLLEYYSDLHEKIGEYAIYNFLADYGIHPPPYERLNALAIRTKLGPYVVYSFYARPKDLLKFSYVARRRSLKENFYQRMLDKSRIRNIQRFLDSGGIFPTNVIVSLREGERTFNPIGGSVPHSLAADAGILSVGGSYSACWIIDGQHRLYSFARSKSEDLVCCMAFEEITIEDERRFFLEINREQRPIQADLIWDLEGLANPETYRGVISNIVRTLNNRDPFLGKIFIPVKGPRTDKIVNMAAFCNGIDNAGLARRITPNSVGMENPLYTTVVRTMTNRSASALERYFTLLQESLSDQHRIFVFGNAGIPIMLYLFEPIVARIGRVPSLNDLEKYTRSVADFFQHNYPTADAVRKLKEETNSEGARKNFAKQIGMFLRKELHDRDFWPKMEQLESVAEIIEMERRIAGLIAARLADITTGWEKQRVPQHIYLSAKKRMEQDGTRFDENLDLGDELQIIVQKNNWEDVFEKVFTAKGAFHDQNELRLAFVYLAKIRNPASHGKSVILSRADLDQCEIYLQRFDAVVPQVITEYPAVTSSESA